MKTRQTWNDVYPADASDDSENDDYNEDLMTVVSVEHITV